MIIDDILSYDFSEETDVKRLKDAVVTLQSYCNDTRDTDTFQPPAFECIYIHEVYGIQYEEDIECHTNSGDDIVRDRAIMKGIIFGSPIEENVEEKKSTSWWIWLLFLVLLGILILISLFGG